MTAKKSDDLPIETIAREQVSLVPMETKPLVGDDIAERSPLAPGASPVSVLTGADSISPEERAKRTAGYWNKSAEEIVACAIEVRDAWSALRNNKKDLDTYIAGLVKHGMLTKREAADPEASAKLSRLRKIAEHAPLMRDPVIVRRVGIAYTKMERCCAIYDAIEGTNEQKSEKLIEILDNCPNEEIDRRYLVDAHRKLRHERNARSPHNKEQNSNQLEEKAKPKSPTTWSDLLNTKQRFDKILITLRPADSRRLSQKLADPAKLTKELPIKQILAAGTTTVVVAATIRDLPLVLRELTRDWGFKKSPTVMLAREPVDADIGAARVLVALHRGELKPNIAALWTGDHDADDVVGDVLRLCGGDGRWLHVFADEAREGWTTLVGNDGWIDAPEDEDN